MTAFRAELSVAEDQEVRGILETIYRVYGYDFEHYSRASLHRQLVRTAQRAGASHLKALGVMIEDRRPEVAHLLEDLTVTVTEMFRDPPFYLALRSRVIPTLKMFPSIRIWHAGCATGEEVYATAILLTEAGIYDRCVLYATDISQRALQQAAAGVYSMAAMRAYTANYHASGGAEPFGDYYNAVGPEQIEMKAELRKRMVFSAHNLAMDQVFGEMHLIICRNVLIYFDRELQDHVLDLLQSSLQAGGFLCLGQAETLATSPYHTRFSLVSRAGPIYRQAAPHGPEWRDSNAE